ncbi:hypothetical protein P59_245 [Bacillus phage P59]|nr:hypothetical protein P59_016 [Bacillus phage P59]QIW88842.1 hypothetical protein P59_245 [Bacillus phage P59]
MMVKYTLINYFDVWGNEEDGWEVNNLCKEGELELSDNADDQEVLAALIDFGFIREDVTLEQIDIAAYDLDFIEFFQADNQYPIGRLEIVR